jgi:hypothetical protein
LERRRFSRAPLARDDEFQLRWNFGLEGVARSEFRPFVLARQEWPNND